MFKSHLLLPSRPSDPSMTNGGGGGSGSGGNNDRSGSGSIRKGGSMRRRTDSSTGSFV